MPKEKKKRSFGVLIPLLISQCIGAFNDNGMKAMLPIMAAYQLGKDKMDETNQIVSILLILPFVIFAPLAGWISDRYSKKKVVSNALIAQVLGLSVLLGAMYIQSLSVAFIGFFLLAVQSSFFSPAKKGILKELVGSERLAMAVGWMEMLTMVGILGGAFVAASYFDSLVPKYGGWYAGLILASFAIGFAIFSWILFLPTPETHAIKAEPFKIKILWSYWNDLKFLLREPGLRGAALGDAWFWAVGGFFYLVLVKLSGEIVVGKIGMGSLYGFWFLLLGLGIMLGSLFVAYLNRGRVEIGLSAIGAILLPLTLIFLYFANPLKGTFEYGSLLLGFSGALFFVPLNGFLQDRAKEAERGRVLAASNLMTQLVSICFILIHALLSSLGFSAKQELLIMAVPASLIAMICMRYLFEDFIRACFHLLLKIMYRIKLVGMENFPERNGVLLVSNHLSYADPVFIGAAFSRKVRFLAYSGLAQSKMIRMIFCLTETEIVSPKKSLESIKKCVKKLKDGTPLCVFAEGGISRTGSIFPFKRGILLLAKEAKVPILPVHIDRVWGSIFSMERGRFFWKRPLSFFYQVTVRAGKIMNAGDFNAESVRREVLELGRQSFVERLPSSEKAKRCVEKLLRGQSDEEFIHFSRDLILSRRDFVGFINEQENFHKLPQNLKLYLYTMRGILEQPDGAKKIIASSLRLREIHLWDQEGFEVSLDGNIEVAWIVWAAFLGGRKIEFSEKTIIVYNQNTESGRSVQKVNGLSTEKNGLVSLNYRSVFELDGSIDELEDAFKDNTLGRLLPGLSYQNNAYFCLLGMDGEIDIVDGLCAIDADGFLYYK